MRDLIIVSIVATAAIWSLRRPWIGVMLWTWLSLMNPHRYTWGFAYTAPLAAIAAGCTLLGLLMTRDRQSPFQGSPMTIYLCLCLWITASWLFGVDTDGDYEQWTKVMKINFMTFIAVVLLSKKQQIQAFAWVTALSLAILGAKGGVFTILNGGSYRVWGPPGSFVEDNNHFALALIMIIPLLRFLQLQLVDRRYRMIMTAVMVLCAASALGSHSRGAFLAIIAMALVFWWRSEKKLGMGIMIASAALLLLPFMPDEWWARMNTIQTYEEDASAIGRLNGWHVATQVAMHNIFGGGMSYQHQIFFSLYGLYNTDVIAAHSIYFQILGNHGFIGLFLYLALWFTTFSTAGWLRKNAIAIPEAKWASDLGAMVQVALVGYAVGGAFLSMPYYDLPYNMMAMVVLARKWVEQRRWEYDSDMSLLEFAGLSRRKERVHPAGGNGAN